MEDFVLITPTIIPLANEERPSLKLDVTMAWYSETCKPISPESGRTGKKSCHSWGSGRYWAAQRTARLGFVSIWVGSLPGSTAAQRGRAARENQKAKGKSEKPHVQKSLLKKREFTSLQCRARPVRTLRHFYLEPAKTHDRLPFNLASWRRLPIFAVWDFRQPTDSQSGRSVSPRGKSQTARCRGLRQPAPKDIARAWLLLASDEAAFITGTYILVDGGQLAHG